jgi:hypothetical protein
LASTTTTGSTLFLVLAGGLARLISGWSRLEGRKNGHRVMQQQRDDIASATISEHLINELPKSGITQERLL